MNEFQRRVPIDLKRKNLLEPQYIVPTRTKGTYLLNILHHAALSTALELDVWLFQPARLPQLRPQIEKCSHGLLLRIHIQTIPCD